MAGENAYPTVIRRNWGITKMRTIWQSLAWKEWHEHKWKLVSLAAILGSITLMVMWPLERGSYESFQGLLVCTIVPLSIFVGLGTAASEQSRGTLPFLQSLPVPMWRVALHKVAFGLITIAVSALLCVLIAYLWYRFHYYFGNFGSGADLPYSNKSSGIRPFGFGIRNWFVDCALMLTFVGASFFIWTCAAGVNRKDEISAGAIALTIMAGWLILLILGWQWLIRQNGPPAQWPDGIAKTLAAISWSTAPGGLIAFADGVRKDPQYVLLGLISAAVTHTGLAIWYVRRFGKITERAIRSPQVAVPDASRPDWLAPPRSSTVSAIAWKQFRESGPIVLAGLVGIVGIVAIVYAGNAAIRPKNSNFIPRLVEVYGQVSITFGFMIALVIGIGVFYYDVTPQMNTFWRSRPINPDVWFWSKFLTGLAILLASIYVPILLIAAFSEIVWGDVHVLDARVLRMLQPQTLLIPTLQAALFASAVAMICLVRHAVYAAILSIATIYISGLIGGLAWMVAGLLGWVELNRDWWEPTEMAIVFGLLFSIAVGTIVAWLAVRYDWGWKSRY